MAEEIKGCRCCGEGEFAQIAEMESDTVLCRCEEITLGTVRKWIAEGYDTFDELKRMLRVGMGPCQGRGCRDIVLREICRITGVPVPDIPPGTIRPPVKPVKISLVARDYSGGEWK
jgi:BFD-like [2Fe-2S] binding domain.